MNAPDELLIDLINRTEIEGSGPRVTVVAHGTVITGRITPQQEWAARIAERLRDSDPEAERFAEDFEREAAEPRAYPPVFLHLRDCLVLSGARALPEPFGEVFRVSLQAVSAWGVR
ncbi:hypothetical protein IHE55_07760 [Streptomyces pactum]|uniref:Gas vesicle protein n=1 Tax=Streptomyces pactum TaxID=68249 RepID=A0ABS0NHL5_9ACTN|nr:hypothetical protein [Streptomyces pactum]MBH5334693.1 hypothetical protein [Streptomyces pactum]